MASPLTDELRSYLDAHRVGHLATSDHEGTPHLVPVVFAVMNDAIVFVVDEKPKRTHGRALKRMRNIAANPRVAFLVDDYDDDWSRLGYALFQGDAEIIDGPGVDYDQAVAHLRTRYAQYRDMPLEPARNPVVRIHPRRAHRWQAATGL
jgi:PPOX class probable F420-dependent enzyme